MVLTMFLVFSVGLADVYVAGRFSPAVQGAVGFAGQLLFFFGVLNSNSAPSSCLDPEELENMEEYIYDKMSRRDNASLDYFDKITDCFEHFIIRSR